MVALADIAGEDHEMFKPVLRSALTLTVREFESEQRGLPKDGMIEEESSDRNKKLSTEKKSLLIWYLLEHAKNSSDIKDFLIALLANDSVIYHKY